WPGEISLDTVDNCRRKHNATGCGRKRADVKSMVAVRQQQVLVGRRLLFLELVVVQPQLSSSRYFFLAALVVVVPVAERMLADADVRWSFVWQAMPQPGWRSLGREYTSMSSPLPGRRPIDYRIGRSESVRFLRFVGILQPPPSVALPFSQAGR